MKGTVVAALISGACSLIVGFCGGKMLVNNNITIYADGKNLSLNGKDVEELVSENESLNNRIETLKSDIQEKENELENLQNEIQGKNENLENLKTDLIKNISLVVDSVEAKGKYTGVAKNGEILLSTTALGDYFGKNVTWDAQKNTVYVGDKGSKVAKEVGLWDKPYIDIGDASYFIGDVDEKMIGYEYRDLYNNNSPASNYITYALDGLAKQVSGSFSVDTSKTGDQIQFKVLNENNEILYTSPILTNMASTCDFTIDVSGCLKFTIEIELVTSSNNVHIITNKITNLTVLTTNY